MMRTGWEIAIYYIRGRFLIDLLATIPFDLIGSLIISPGNRFLLSLFGILKLIRVLRIGRIMYFLNLKDDYLYVSCLASSQSRASKYSN